MSISSIGGGIGQGVELSITSHGRRHSREPVRLTPKPEENLAQKLEAIARVSDPGAASLQTTNDEVRRHAANVDQQTKGTLLDEMA